MKPERRHIDFLQEIVDNLEKAECFVEGMDFVDFLADEKIEAILNRERSNGKKEV